MVALILVQWVRHTAPLRVPLGFFTMPESSDPKMKHLYEFGPFRVDPEKELLLRGEEAVALTPKTFQILLVLVRHSQEIVTKEDMLKTVWPDTFVEEANLSRNIFLLRKALGETPQDHQYVVTVPGRGYRFAEDVQLVPQWLPARAQHCCGKPCQGRDRGQGDSRLALVRSRWARPRHSRLSERFTGSFLVRRS